MSRSEKFAREIPTLPSWWTIFQIVAVAAVGLIIIFGALRAGGSGSTAVDAARADRAVAPPTVTTDPTRPAPTPNPTRPAPDPVVEQTETMKLPTGTEVEVPTAAITVASAAAVAQYTGNYADVPTVGTPERPSRTYPTPEVLGLDLRSKSANTYVFDARISLNPADPSATTYTPVAVQIDSGTWSFVAPRAGGR